MRTLKITLALVAIAMLTVSGVQSETVVNTDDSYKQNSKNIDLLAHGKGKMKLPSNS